MITYLIEPRDPLIVRDGKPIGGDAAIETLPFPFPSTIAGAVRTRMASPNGAFLFPNQNKALDELIKIPVAGPVLTEVDASTEMTIRFYFPSPRDAVVFPHERDVTKVEVQRLVPRTEAMHGLMDSLQGKGLCPIGTVTGVERTEKPFAKAPAFWNQDLFLEWLASGTLNGAPLAPSDLGLDRLPTETRMHVVMQPGERVSKDGGLFQTKALRFVHGTFGKPRHFALSIRTEPKEVDGHALAMRDELAPLGGERRLARWQASTVEWPVLPLEIDASVKKNRTARLVLLTPAMFAHGALPDWNGKPWRNRSGPTVTVEGACVGRPEVVSGWNMRKGARGEKPTRRLAPAGSVYFVRLAGTDEDIDAWLMDTWMQCVSDDPQDCLDGFGLAVVGVWEDGR